MWRASMVVLLGAVMLAVAACGSSRPAHTTTSTAAPAHWPKLTNPNSVRAVLRFTRKVPCIDGSQPLGGPAAIRRFHAVAAVACTREFHTFPRKGKWVVYVRRVVVGSVDALEEYFEQPNDPKCSADEDDDTLRVPVLVDAKGRMLVPLIPDVCGEAHEDGEDPTGSRRVRWHVVWLRRVRHVPQASSP